MQRPLEHLIIMTTTDSSGKIYIREQFGYFQALRRSIGTVLMLLFIGLPLISINGRQAFRIDVDRLAIEWFGFIVLPQDFWLVGLIFGIAAFTLFYLTKLYGRIWCGYSCPQTIWTLLFVWVERRIEGSAAKSKALDQIAWRSVQGVRKFGVRVLKHVVWGCIALLTALVFVSYFVPARNLYIDFFKGEATSSVNSWVCFFALCTYINAGLIREKMCLHMCPYARFQSSMFDQATQLVTYDVNRGESRGSRKKSAEKPTHLGDCVDCKLCVQVCPVGIDIRNGLQYECINCGLCVDACDDTMRQFNYPTGLIRYQSDIKPRGYARVSRHACYGLAILTLAIAIMGWFQSFSTTAINISRDRQQFTRLNSDGELENTFTLRLSNKKLIKRQYQVHLEGLPKASIKQRPILKLEPSEDREFIVTVSVSECPSKKFSEFYFVIGNSENGEEIREKASFYGGDCSEI